MRRLISGFFLINLLQVTWIKPGYAAGMAAVDDFGMKRLAHYADKRNDPTLNGVSKLSPYYHFGQVSCVDTGMEAPDIDCFSLSNFPDLRGFSHYAPQEPLQQAQCGLCSLR